MQQLSIILAGSMEPPFPFTYILSFTALPVCILTKSSLPPPSFFWVPRPTLKLIDYSRGIAAELTDYRQGNSRHREVCPSAVRALPNTLRRNSIVSAHCGSREKDHSFAHTDAWVVCDFSWVRRSPEFEPRIAAVSKHRQASPRSMPTMVTEPHTRYLSLTRFWKWHGFPPVTQDHLQS